MTLILEFEHKLIFYKPGILRYAMRHARMQFGVPQSAAERRQLLSLSLQLGWAEARAEFAALRRVQALASEARTKCLGHADRDALQIGSGSNDGLIHNRTDNGELAPPTALVRRQLH